MTDSESVTAHLRRLPSISALISDPEVQQRSTLGEAALAEALREALAEERSAILAGNDRSSDEVRSRVLASIERLESSRLNPILNGTGVIIHTNLGRAPVSDQAAAAMAAAAGGFVPLEVDAETNERGGRMREIAGLMRLLTGAESCLVVNNNAAAVLLVLTTIASGRAVILSRGEAVEIGGGFRMPDVLRQSGAVLVEVGTTNRTYARDYDAAIDEQTAALLKVHPSNFRVLGFTHEATVEELARIAKGRGLPVIDDLGSGALIDTTRYGLAAEPMPKASLAAGAAVVTVSGDKLVGGPQAGLILGDRAYVDRISAHPLARALRADKTCLAGLAVTLRHYLRDEAETHVPVWRMIAAAPDQLRMRAQAARDQVSDSAVAVGVSATESTIGGGSLPGQTLPSFAVTLKPGIEQPLGADDLARRLRIGRPGVFGRIAEDALLIDLRTVLPEDDPRLVAAIRSAVRA